MPPHTHLRVVQETDRSVPRVPQHLKKVLNNWLASLSWAQLICRDVGHIWTTAFTPGESYTPTRQGSWAIREPCLRGCGVKRRRFIGSHTGWLVNPNTMDYTGSPHYQVPEELASWSGTRDLRGKVRLEAKRRVDEGENPPAELLKPVRLYEESAPL